MCGPAADPGPDRPAGRQGDLEVEVQGSGLSEQALRSRMQGKVNPQAERWRPARHQPGGDDPRGAGHPDRQGADQVKEVRKTDFSAPHRQLPRLPTGLPGATTSSCLPRPAGEGAGQTALGAGDPRLPVPHLRGGEQQGQGARRWMSSGHHHTGAHRRPLAGAELQARREGAAQQQQGAGGEGPARRPSAVSRSCWVTRPTTKG